MSELISPVETVIEFVFFGQFTPKNFEPSWLYRKEIFHSREVKEINEIRINDAEVFYTTDLISFNITYDSFVLKTNSKLTYDSLLTVAKRIVNVLRSDLSSEFNLNIRYHFKNPSNSKSDIYMKELIKDGFWSGIVEEAKPLGLLVSKSVQQKEFLWRSDINVSLCNREGSKGRLIHVFFRNSLNLNQLPNEGKGQRSPQKHVIAKFMRLDEELMKIKKRCEIIGKNITKKYFSIHV